MDPTSLVIPGAQALVTQILSEGWTQTRQWFARQLKRRGDSPQLEIEHRLEKAHIQACALMDPSRVGASGARPLLEAYWTGYLAALVDEHPELVSILEELAVSVTGGTANSGISNSVTGAVTGNVIQAGNIEGGVRFV